ncbi:MAG TPA: arginase family protein [Herpetosiphonaceae bacterium]
MTDRRLAVLDAPSNLGLRPPEPGSVPGCYKLPWALRDRNLVASIDATDAGALVPPRYRAEWHPGDGTRNAAAIAAFSTQLADRLGALIEAERLPLVLGGDCSILVGNTLALKRRGRYGLVYIDAHSDFRHPQNAPAIEAAAGEDLAIVTGRGDPRLINLEGCGPYVREADVALLGVRDGDECLPELAELDFTVITSGRVAEIGAEQAAAQALTTATGSTQGFWIHLDLDVIDSAELPAVDSPEPNGLSFATLAALLKPLLSSPACAGLELTIYDPDLDPHGHYADRIMAFLGEVFGSTAPAG